MAPRLALSAWPTCCMTYSKRRCGRAQPGVPNTWDNSTVDRQVLLIQAIPSIVLFLRPWSSKARSDRTFAGLTFWWLLLVRYSTLIEITSPWSGIRAS